MVQIRRDVEEIGFPVQNIYKMTYSDENATFEPLNLWTRERLKEYLKNRQDNPAFRGAPTAGSTLHYDRHG